MAKGYNIGSGTQRVINLVVRLKREGNLAALNEITDQLHKARSVAEGVMHPYERKETIEQIEGRYRRVTEIVKRFQNALRDPETAKRFGGIGVKLSEVKGLEDAAKEVDVLKGKYSEFRDLINAVTANLSKVAIRVDEKGLNQAEKVVMRLVNRMTWLEQTIEKIKSSSSTLSRGGIETPAEAPGSAASQKPPSVIPPAHRKVLETLGWKDQSIEGLDYGQIESIIKNNLYYTKNTEEKLKKEASKLAKVQSQSIGSSFVVMDTETTGLQENARILEIAFAKFNEQGKVVRKIRKMFRVPTEQLGSEAEKIHGITQGDVEKQADTFADRGKQLSRIMELITEGGKLPIVGQNVDFDIGKLEREFREAKQDMPNVRYEDIITLAKRVISQQEMIMATGSKSYAADNLIAYFRTKGIDVTKDAPVTRGRARHTAAGDVHIEGQINYLLRLMEQRKSLPTEDASVGKNLNALGSKLVELTQMDAVSGEQGLLVGPSSLNSILKGGLEKWVDSSLAARRKTGGASYRQKVLGEKDKFGPGELESRMGTIFHAVVNEVMKDQAKALGKEMPLSQAQDMLRDWLDKFIARTDSYRLLPGRKQEAFEGFRKVSDKAMAGFYKNIFGSGAKIVSSGERIGMNIPGVSPRDVSISGELDFVAQEVINGVSQLVLHDIKTTGDSDVTPERAASWKRQALSYIALYEQKHGKAIRKATIDIINTKTGEYKPFRLDLGANDAEIRKNIGSVIGEYGKIAEEIIKAQQEVPDEEIERIGSMSKLSGTGQSQMTLDKLLKNLGRGLSIRNKKGVEIVRDRFSSVYKFPQDSFASKNFNEVFDQFIKILRDIPVNQRASMGVLEKWQEAVQIVKENVKSRPETPTQDMVGIQEINKVTFRAIRETLSKMGWSGTGISQKDIPKAMELLNAEIRKIQIPVEESKIINAPYGTIPGNLRAEELLRHKDIGPIIKSFIEKSDLFQKGPTWNRRSPEFMSVLGRGRAQMEKEIDIQYGSLRNLIFQNYPESEVEAIKKDLAGIQNQQRQMIEGRFSELVTQLAKRRLYERGHQTITDRKLRGEESRILGTDEDVKSLRGQATKEVTAMPEYAELQRSADAVGAFVSNIIQSDKTLLESSRERKLEAIKLFEKELLKLSSQPSTSVASTLAQQVIERVTKNDLAFLRERMQIIQDNEQGMIDELERFSDRSRISVDSLLTLAKARTGYKKTGAHEDEAITFLRSDSERLQTLLDDFEKGAPTMAIRKMMNDQKVLLSAIRGYRGAVYNSIKKEVEQLGVSADESSQVAKFVMREAKGASTDQERAIFAPKLKGGLTELIRNVTDLDTVFGRVFDSVFTSAEEVTNFTGSIPLQVVKAVEQPAAISQKAQEGVFKRNRLFERMVTARQAMNKIMSSFDMGSLGIVVDKTNNVIELLRAFNQARDAKIKGKGDTEVTIPSSQVVSIVDQIKKLDFDAFKAIQSLGGIDQFHKLLSKYRKRKAEVVDYMKQHEQAKKAGKSGYFPKTEMIPEDKILFDLGMEDAGELGKDIYKYLNEVYGDYTGSIRNYIRGGKQTLDRLPQLVMNMLRRGSIDIPSMMIPDGKGGLTTDVSMIGEIPAEVTADLNKLLKGGNFEGAFAQATSLSRKYSRSALMRNIYAYIDTVMAPLSKKARKLPVGEYQMLDLDQDIEKYPSFMQDRAALRQIQSGFFEPEMRRMYMATQTPPYGTGPGINLGGALTIPGKTGTTVPYQGAIITGAPIGGRGDVSVADLVSEDTVKSFKQFSEISQIIKHMFSSWRPIFGEFYGLAAQTEEFMGSDKVERLRSSGAYIATERGGMTVLGAGTPERIPSRMMHETAHAIFERDDILGFTGRGRPSIKPTYDTGRVSELFETAENFRTDFASALGMFPKFGESIRTAMERLSVTPAELSAIGKKSGNFVDTITINQILKAAEQYKNFQKVVSSQFIERLADQAMTVYGPQYDVSRRVPAHENMSKGEYTATRGVAASERMSYLLGEMGPLAAQNAMYGAIYDPAKMGKAFGSGFIDKGSMMKYLSEIDEVKVADTLNTASEAFASLFTTLRESVDLTEFRNRTGILGDFFEELIGGTKKLTTLFQVMKGTANLAEIVAKKEGMDFNVNAARSVMREVSQFVRAISQVPGKKEAEEAMVPTSAQGIADQKAGISTTQRELMESMKRDVIMKLIEKQVETPEQMAGMSEADLLPMFQKSFLEIFKQVYRGRESKIPASWVQGFPGEYFQQGKGGKTLVIDRLLKTPGGSKIIEQSAEMLAIIGQAMTEFREEVGSGDPSKVREGMAQAVQMREIANLKDIEDQFTRQGVYRQGGVNNRIREYTHKIIERYKATQNIPSGTEDVLKYMDELDTLAHGESGQGVLFPAFGLKDNALERLKNLVAKTVATTFRITNAKGTGLEGKLSGFAELQKEKERIASVSPGEDYERNLEGAEQQLRDMEKSVMGGIGIESSVLGPEFDALAQNKYLMNMAKKIQGLEKRFLTSAFFSGRARFGEAWDAPRRGERTGAFDLSKIKYSGGITDPALQALIASIFGGGFGAGGFGEPVSDLSMSVRQIQGGNLFSGESFGGVQQFWKLMEGHTNSLSKALTSILIPRLNETMLGFEMIGEEGRKALKSIEDEVVGLAQDTPEYAQKMEKAFAALSPEQQGLLQASAIRMTGEDKFTTGVFNQLRAIENKGAAFKTGGIVPYLHKVEQIEKEMSIIDSLRKGAFDTWETDLMQSTDALQMAKRNQGVVAKSKGRKKAAETIQTAQERLNTVRQEIEQAMQAMYVMDPLNVSLEINWELATQGKKGVKQLMEQVRRAVSTFSGDFYKNRMGEVKGLRVEAQDAYLKGMENAVLETSSADRLSFEYKQKQLEETLKIKQAIESVTFLEKEAVTAQKDSIPYYRQRKKLLEDLAGLRRTGQIRDDLLPESQYEKRPTWAHVSTPQASENMFKSTKVGIAETEKAIEKSKKSFTDYKKHLDNIMSASTGMKKYTHPLMAQTLTSMSMKMYKEVQGYLDHYEEQYRDITEEILTMQKALEGVHGQERADLEASIALRQRNAEEINQFVGKLRAISVENEQVARTTMKQGLMHRQSIDSFKAFWRTTTQGFADMIVSQTAWIAGFGVIFGLMSIIQRTFKETYDQADNLARAMRTTRGELLSVAETAEKFSSVMRHALNAYGVDFKTTGEILYQLGSAGLTAEESLAAFDTTLKTIIGTEADAQATTKMVAGIYLNFKKELLEVDDTVVGLQQSMSGLIGGIGSSGALINGFNRINNLAVRAFREHLIEQDEYVQGMNMLIATGRTAGLSLEQMTAMLSLLNDRMIKGSRAGRGIQVVLQHLTKDAEKFAQTFKIDIPMDKPLDIIDILDQLNKRMKDGVYNTEQMAIMFQNMGLRGAAPFITLVRDFEEYQKFVKDFSENSADAAEKMAQIKMDAPSMQFKMFSETLINFVRVGMEPAAASLLFLVRRFNDVANAARDAGGSIKDVGAKSETWSEKAHKYVGVLATTYGALMLGGAFMRHLERNSPEGIASKFVAPAVDMAGRVMTAPTKRVSRILPGITGEPVTTEAGTTRQVTGWFGKPKGIITEYTREIDGQKKVFTSYIEHSGKVAKAVEGNFEKVGKGMLSTGTNISTGLKNIISSPTVSLLGWVVAFEAASWILNKFATATEKVELAVTNSIQKYKEAIDKQKNILDVRDKVRQAVQEVADTEDKSKQEEIISKLHQEVLKSMPEMASAVEMYKEKRIDLNKVMEDYIALQEQEIRISKEKVLESKLEKVMPKGAWREVALPFTAESGRSSFFGGIIGDIEKGSLIAEKDFFAGFEGRINQISLALEETRKRYKKIVGEELTKTDVELLEEIKLYVPGTESPFNVYGQMFIKSIGDAEKKNSTILAESVKRYANSFTAAKILIDSLLDQVPSTHPLRKKLEEMSKEISVYMPEVKIEPKAGIDLEMKRAKEYVTPFTSWVQTAPIETREFFANIGLWGSSAEKIFEDATVNLRENIRVANEEMQKLSVDISKPEFKGDVTATYERITELRKGIEENSKKETAILKNQVLRMIGDATWWNNQIFGTNVVNLKTSLSSAAKMAETYSGDLRTALRAPFEVSRTEEMSRLKNDIMSLSKIFKETVDSYKNFISQQFDYIDVIIEYGNTKAMDQFSKLGDIGPAIMGVLDRSRDFQKSYLTAISEAKLVGLGSDPKNFLKAEVTMMQKRNEFEKTSQSTILKLEKEMSDIKLSELKLRQVREKALYRSFGNEITELDRQIFERMADNSLVFVSNEKNDIKDRISTYETFAREATNIMERFYKGVGQKSEFYSKKLDIFRGLRDSSKSMLDERISKASDWAVKTFGPGPGTFGYNTRALFVQGISGVLKDMGKSVRGSLYGTEEELIKDVAIAFEQSNITQKEMVKILLNNFPKMRQEQAEWWASSFQLSKDYEEMRISTDKAASQSWLSQIETFNVLAEKYEEVSGKRDRGEGKIPSETKEAFDKRMATELYEIIKNQLEVIERMKGVVSSLPSGEQPAALAAVIGMTKDLYANEQAIIKYVMSPKEVMSELNKTMEKLIDTIKKMDEHMFGEGKGIEKAVKEREKGIERTKGEQKKVDESWKVAEALLSLGDLRKVIEDQKFNTDEIAKAMMATDMTPIKNAMNPLFDAAKNLADLENITDKDVQEKVRKLQNETKDSLARMGLINREDYAERFLTREEVYNLMQGKFQSIFSGLNVEEYTKQFGYDSSYQKDTVNLLDKIEKNTRLSSKGMTLKDNYELQQTIETVAKLTGVPEKLLKAVIMAESGGMKGQTSPTGATGYGQITRSTAQTLSEKTGYSYEAIRGDTFENVFASAWYLDFINRMNKGDWKKTIMGYKEGPYVKDWNKPIAPGEKQTVGERGEHHTGKVANYYYNVYQGEPLGGLPRPGSKEIPPIAYAERPPIQIPLRPEVPGIEVVPPEAPKTPEVPTAVANAQQNIQSATQTIGSVAVTAGAVILNAVMPKAAEAKTEVDGYAWGGFVSGPGGPKDDKIPAWLSNGEFVQPAKSVKEYGVSFFEKLRNLQIPKKVVEFIMGGDDISVDNLMEEIAKEGKRQKLAEGGMPDNPWIRQIPSSVGKRAILPKLPFGIARFEDQSLEYMLENALTPSEINIRNRKAYEQYEGGSGIERNPLFDPIDIFAGAIGVKAFSNLVKNRASKVPEYIAEFGLPRGKNITDVYKETSEKFQSEAWKKIKERIPDPYIPPYERPSPRFAEGGSVRMPSITGKVFSDYDNYFDEVKGRGKDISSYFKAKYKVDVIPELFDRFNKSHEEIKKRISVMKNQIPEESHKSVYSTSNEFRPDENFYNTVAPSGAAAAKEINRIFEKYGRPSDYVTKIEIEPSETDAKGSYYMGPKIIAYNPEIATLDTIRHELGHGIDWKSRNKVPNRREKERLLADIIANASGKDSIYMSNTPASVKRVYPESKYAFETFARSFADMENMNFKNDFTYSPWKKGIDIISKDIDIYKREDEFENIKEKIYGILGFAEGGQVEDWRKSSTSITGERAGLETVANRTDRLENWRRGWDIQERQRFAGIHKELEFLRNMSGEGEFEQSPQVFIEERRKRLKEKYGEYWSRKFSQSNIGPNENISTNYRGMIMPRFGQGGVVTRPTVALIGENGPEAVIPIKNYADGGPILAQTDYSRARLADIMWREANKNNERISSKEQDSFTRMTSQGTIRVEVDDVKVTGTIGGMDRSAEKEVSRAVKEAVKRVMVDIDRA